MRMRLMLHLLSHQPRHVLIESQPWILGHDLCDALFMVQLWVGANDIERRPELYELPRHPNLPAHEIGVSEDRLCNVVGNLAFRSLAKKKVVCYDPALKLERKSCGGNVARVECNIVEEGREEVGLWRPLPLGKLISGDNGAIVVDPVRVIEDCRIDGLGGEGGSCGHEIGRRERERGEGDGAWGTLAGSLEDGIDVAFEYAEIKFAGERHYIIAFLVEVRDEFGDSIQL